MMVVHIVRSSFPSRHLRWERIGERSDGKRESNGRGEMVGCVRTYESNGRYCSRRHEGARVSSREYRHAESWSCTSPFTAAIIDMICGRKETCGRGTGGEGGNAAVGESSCRRRLMKAKSGDDGRGGNGDSARRSVRMRACTGADDAAYVPAAEGVAASSKQTKLRTKRSSHSSRSGSFVAPPCLAMPSSFASRSDSESNGVGNTGWPPRL
jgi:hypothetical protein